MFFFQSFDLLVHDEFLKLNIRTVKVMYEKWCTLKVLVNMNTLPIREMRDILCNFIRLAGNEIAKFIINLPKTILIIGNFCKYSIIIIMLIFMVEI